MVDTSVMEISDKKTFYVYILYCENDTFYTGYTNDVVRRYQSHLNGTGKCKYTKSFKPIGIAQCWGIEGDKAIAMRVERYIKKLSRAEKEGLIKRPQSLYAVLSMRFNSRMSIAP